MEYQSEAQKKLLKYCENATIQEKVEDKRNTIKLKANQSYHSAFRQTNFQHQLRGVNLTDHACMCRYTRNSRKS